MAQHFRCARYCPPQRRSSRCQLDNSRHAQLHAVVRLRYRVLGNAFVLLPPFHSVGMGSIRVFVSLSSFHPLTLVANARRRADYYDLDKYYGTGYGQPLGAIQGFVAVSSPVPSFSPLPFLLFLFCRPSRPPYGRISPLPLSSSRFISLPLQATDLFFSSQRRIRQRAHVPLDEQPPLRRCRPDTSQPHPRQLGHDLPARPEHLCRLLSRQPDHRHPRRPRAQEGRCSSLFLGSLDISGLEDVADRSVRWQGRFGASVVRRSRARPDLDRAFLFAASHHSFPSSLSSTLSPSSPSFLPSFPPFPSFLG